MLKGFDVKMIYYDYHRLNTVEEFVLGARYTILYRLVEQSNIITITPPLIPQTDGMFNRDLLFRMKKGADHRLAMARTPSVDHDTSIYIHEKVISIGLCKKYFAPCTLHQAY
jgi:lactate dehydrogenase-like 2-hydroxyacid dehydrogenase